MKYKKQQARQPKWNKNAAAGEKRRKNTANNI